MQIEEAKVYTDGATAYDGLPFDHESVNHYKETKVLLKMPENGV